MTRNAAKSRHASAWQLRGDREEGYDKAGKMGIPLPPWPQSASPTGAKEAEEHDNMGALPRAARRLRRRLPWAGMLRAFSAQIQDGGGPREECRQDGGGPREECRQDGGGPRMNAARGAAYRRVLRGLTQN